MAQKVMILADPGIDTAIAVALALHDPTFQVVGLLATAGNVDAEQATQNVHILIDQLDPSRWPRLGAALPFSYEFDGLKLHGAGGLGGMLFPAAKLHSPTPSDKLLVDLARQYPKEITLITLAPLTVLALALDREPELRHLLDRVICVGGTWHEPGDAGAVAELHFACDPISTRQVLGSGLALTLLPLDLTRKLVLSPTDLYDFTNPASRTGQFLRQIVPFGIRATSNLYGIEGFQINDVLGVACLALPKAVGTHAVYADIEIRGELTRGMCVIDTRSTPAAKSNVDLGVELDVVAVRDHMRKILMGAP